MRENECQDSCDIGRNVDKVYNQKEKVNKNYKISSYFLTGLEWAYGWVEAIYYSLNLVVLWLSQCEDREMILYSLIFLKDNFNLKVFLDSTEKVCVKKETHLQILSLCASQINLDREHLWAKCAWT